MILDKNILIGFLFVIVLVSLFSLGCSHLNKKQGDLSEFKEFYQEVCNGSGDMKVCNNLGILAEKGRKYKSS